MITSAFRWFDALIRRCILCDTDCCHCLRVYVLPTVSLRPSRARSDAIRRSSLRLVFSARRATDDASAALSGGLAANALSPFSPKWRATGVRSASPYDGPDLAPLPGGAISVRVACTEIHKNFWETELCLANRRL
jgi:hypothetical protein